MHGCVEACIPHTDLVILTPLHRCSAWCCGCLTSTGEPGGQGGPSDTLQRRGVGSTQAAATGVVQSRWPAQFSPHQWYVCVYCRYYSLFTLFMLVSFECTVVHQRLRNLKELRSMQTAKQEVQVYRYEGQGQGWGDSVRNRSQERCRVGALLVGLAVTINECKRQPGWVGTCMNRVPRHACGPTHAD